MALSTTFSPRRRTAAESSSEAGFTLLAVILGIAVMNIFLGVAVARWSFINQRDREMELIWRGEQYSRALKCYLGKTGVPPTDLQDLVEENCIRRLYRDPMSSSGEWKILRASDLGEEGLQFVASLMSEEGELSGEEGEELIQEEEEAGASSSRLGVSTALDRIRSRRAGGASPSGQPDSRASSRFGSRFGSRFSRGGESTSEESGSTLGSMSLDESADPTGLGQEGGESERQSLIERAQGRLRDRLAARDLTGGRGRRSLQGDMMRAILGVSTSGSGESIRTYSDKNRYEDWQFTLAGQLDQDPQIPGLPSGAPLDGDDTGIPSETEERQSRFRRPSLRRGG
jgi:type II secretory pathway pseudopilin PulG